MFVLSQSQSYFWPVVVELPATGGRYEKHTFDAEFKRLPQSKINELGKLVDASEISGVDFCREVLVGWKGVQDNSGGEIPFSESARDSLLEVQLVATAIAAAFFKSLTGAKLKN